MNPLVIVGDSLLDRDLDGHAHRLAPDAPIPVVDDPTEHTRPGGAALAARLAAGDGRPVTFVTALGDDAAGVTVADMLERAGVRVIALRLAGGTAQKVRVRAAGQSLVRVDYGGPAGEPDAPGPDALDAIRQARAVLVSDYGRGITAQHTLRAALEQAADAGARITWDPHPRGAAPTGGTRLVTPNLAELQRLAGGGEDGSSMRAVTAMAARLRDLWETAEVAVTLGARGALLVSGDGTPLMVPAPALHGTPDACGAGDRFAASVAGGLADGAMPSEAVVGAVRVASAFIAGGGAGAVGVAVPETDHDSRPTGDTMPATGHDSDPTATASDLIAATRARGGTVVATGGCFDLLHAGHVRVLTDARRLGDCLIVCINSDASVRRLKGSGRPVVHEGDRRAVLMGLAAVDAVAVFDEDTPERILADLRPDIWVKGADYGVADLPEAELVASWGGQAVVLPYLDGRSTTSMIKEAVRNARQ